MSNINITYILGFKTSIAGGSQVAIYQHGLGFELETTYNHGQKSWDTFAFLGRFPIFTGPPPSFTPQTMLDACIQNFFRVSTFHRVGGGRIARKFRKGCTILRGNREMTEKYEYCSTVPKKSRYHQLSLVRVLDSEFFKSR